MQNGRNPISMMLDFRNSVATLPVAQKHWGLSNFMARCGIFAFFTLSQTMQITGGKGGFKCQSGCLNYPGEVWRSLITKK